MRSATLERRDPLRPAERRRFPLDPLRAVAAMVVVATHVYVNQLRTMAAPTAGQEQLSHVFEVAADAAVMLFFVLSSFVLYLPASRAALAGREPVTWQDMLLRRVVRLLPLYVVVVVVVWAMTNTSLPGNWRDLALHLTMTHVYSDKYIFWTNGPAWSLAVEFHYYVLMAIVTPLVVRWAGRSPSRRVRIARVSTFPAALVVVGVAYLLWAVATQEHGAWHIWFGPLSMAAIFGMGLALAVAVASGVELRHRAVRGALVVAAVATFGYVAAVRNPYDVQDQLWRLALGLAATALIASIVMTTGAVPRWLVWKPLVSIGLISYGIYLLHEPVMRFARWSGLLFDGADGLRGLLAFAGSTAIVLALTVALAKFSYGAIELNAMRILATFEPGARLRDYYAHTLDEVDLPPRRVVRPAAASPQPTRAV